MHSSNIRYGQHKSKLQKKKPVKLVGKVIKQTIACAVAFLICLPISKTQSGLRDYISKTLTVSSDIEGAREHFGKMCALLGDKYPVLEENDMWKDFIAFAVEQEEAVPQAQPAEDKSEEQAVDLAEKAAEEFTYPENVNMIMPLDGAVTSPFGMREHPVSGEDASHYGVDIAGSRGDAVVTTAPGKVIEVKVHDIYGNCVLVQHTDRIKSFYAHLDMVNVAEGDILKDGAQIGTVGSTGVTTGPHLHFGVRVDEEPTDPEKYIKMEHRQEMF